MGRASMCEIPWASSKGSSIYQLRNQQLYSLYVELYSIGSIVHQVCKNMIWRVIAHAQTLGFLDVRG